MAVEVKTKERQIQIDSPLGKDALVATDFDGSEAVSEHFHYRLELISPQLAIKPADILGKSVTVRVMFPQTKERYFNGIVVRFAPGPMWGRGNRRYTAELAPWTWLLTRTTDCRIFENKSAPDIVQEVFKDLGFTDFELNLKGNHPRREYCVQYRETDFNFVSRLLEEEGIFYFFKHEKGKHTLMLADQGSAYLDCQDKQVKFGVNPEALSKVTQWRNGYNYRPGKWTQRDYNFERPSDDLKTTKNTVINVPQNQKFELFDYPGLYMNKGDGDDVTKRRMEAEEAAFQAVEGEGNCSFFSPGYKFELVEHECKDEQDTYVLTSVRHMATDYTHVSGEGSPPAYSNTFTCMPASRVFRPLRKTEKPVVHGPHTAVVTGPSGEEIYTDKYGRIRARFFWEREGKNSCWMRVAHAWAGKKFGTIMIPRVGWEVVVHFLEGDPDRPLVTGCVYNADNMPPYGLPDNKTQSGWKSHSSVGGGDSDFNELRYEDKKGS
jgi:type VI secretion system secreted protein VgrG